MFLYHGNQRFPGHQKCKAFLRAKCMVMVSGIGLLRSKRPSKPWMAGFFITILLKLILKSRK